jgi:pantothenate synthetase
MNAAFIYKAINQLKEDTLEMDLNEALQKAKQFISAQKGAKLDYLVAVDANTLSEVSRMDQTDAIAILTVVEYEGVRLLDNILLN